MGKFDMLDTLSVFTSIGVADQNQVHLLEICPKTIQPTMNDQNNLERTWIRTENIYHSPQQQKMVNNPILIKGISPLVPIAASLNVCNTLNNEHVYCSSRNIRMFRHFAAHVSWYNTEKE